MRHEIMRDIITILKRPREVVRGTCREVYIFGALTLRFVQMTVLYITSNKARCDKAFFRGSVRFYSHFVISQFRNLPDDFRSELGRDDSKRQYGL